MNWTMAVMNLLLVGLIGTGVQAQQSDATNFEQAVQLSEELPTKEQKVGYLIKEAQEFLNDQQYEFAKKTAQHILVELDNTSQEARHIYQVAMQKIQEAEGGLNSLSNPQNGK